jgi:hypothetical protein
MDKKTEKALSAAMSSFGRKGAKVANAKRSAKERSEIARAAARARWAKQSETRW